MRHTYTITDLKNARQEHGPVVALRMAVSLAFSRKFIFENLKGAVSFAWVLVLTVLSVCWGIALYRFLDRGGDAEIFQYGGFALSRDTFLRYGLVFPGALFWWAIRASDKMTPRPKKPEPSGVFGKADLERTDSALRAAKLIGRNWGEGVRLGRSFETGEVIRYCGGNSMICFGPSGEGKFTNIQCALVQEFAGSAVLIDPAAQIAAVCIEEQRKGKRVVVLSPFTDLPYGIPELLGPTAHYNPMQALLNPDAQNFQIMCDKIAEMVVPESLGGGEDGNVWLTEARSLVSGVIMQLMLGSGKDRQNLAEVAYIIRSRRIFEFATTAIENMEGEEDPKRREQDRFVRERLEKFTEKKSRTDKTKASILITADAGLAFLSNSAIGGVVKKSDFRFAELKDGDRPTIVFLILPTNYAEDCKNWFRMVLASALTELSFTEAGKHQVLVMADEASLLGKLEVLQRTYTEGRKRGVQAFSFFQNILQAESLYGEAWENMMSGARVQIFMRPNDPKTAEYMSKLTGKRTVVTALPSINDRGENTIGHHEHAQPVLDPHQIMNLKGILLFVRGMEVDNVNEMRKSPYWEDPKIRAMCSRDPYAPRGI